MDFRSKPVHFTAPTMGQQGPWRMLDELPSTGVVIMRSWDGSEHRVDVGDIGQISNFTSWRPED